jgi:hypothetical protein
MENKKGFKFKLRKRAIALKRNYYTVPLIFVLASCLQFLMSLFIFSSAFYRLPVSFSSIDPLNQYVNAMPDFLKNIYTVLWPYNCIFLFVITLFTILYSVAYLQYSMQKYGEKRPVYMLIIFFVLWAINIILVLFIYQSNKINYWDDFYKLTLDPNNVTLASYVVKEKQTKTLLMVHLILSIITGVVVATAPLVQKQLKKITFKPLEENEQKE